MGCCLKIRICYRRFAGSTVYYFLSALLAIAPLYDIVTDWVFITHLGFNDEKEDYHRYLALLSFAFLWNSSRQVLGWKLFSKQRPFVISSILYSFFPCLDILDMYHFYTNENATVSLELWPFTSGYGKLIQMLFLILFYIISPLVHTALVIYYGMLHMKASIWNHESNALFLILAFLEVFESLPQLTIQSLVYVLNGRNLSDATIIAFWISATASVISVIRVGILYKMRIQVIREGFLVKADGATDVSLFCKHLHANDYFRAKKFLIRVFEKNSSPELKKCWEALRQKEGGNALCIACQCGVFQEKWVKKNNIDLEFSDNASGNTPLIAASSNGKTKVVKQLLKLEADVHATNLANDDALKAAIANKHLDVVTLLMKHGSDIESKNRKQQTALILASTVKGNVKIVSHLIENNAQLEAVEEWGTTSVLYATWYGNRKIVDELLARGANVNAACVHGRTPIIAAVEKTHVGIVKTLIAANADLQVTFDGHNLPLIDGRNINLTPLEFALEIEKRDETQAARNVVSFLQDPHGAGMVLRYHSDIVSEVSEVSLVVSEIEDIDIEDSSFQEKGTSSFPEMRTPELHE